MSSDDRRKNEVSRRQFFKTAGLAGAFVATGGLTPPAYAAEQAAPTEMPRRRLGKTGVNVSVLALGGMFDTLNNQPLLRQAFNWGVTYWDTAEGYGGGMSEEGFGRWFARNQQTRKDIFLATKSGSGRPGELDRRLGEALERLQTDYVDLFFRHGVSDIDEMTTEWKDWAERAKKSGKVRFVGFSTHSNMEDCLLGAAKLPWLDVLMFSYNFRLMQTPKMKQAVDACVRADLGLVAMKTMGGGPVKADSETELALAGRFLEKGFSDKQAKLKAVWEDTRIATICSQMPSLTILGTNVAAARNQTKLSREDRDLMERLARETGHGYCAGCSRICSTAMNGQAPVAEVMRYLMYYRDYNDRDLARASFAALPEETRAGLADLDYTAAQRACPQGLPITTLMREAASLLA